MLWKSRQQAGEQLGRALKEYRKKHESLDIESKKQDTMPTLFDTLGNGFYTSFLKWLRGADCQMIYQFTKREKAVPISGDLGFDNVLRYRI